MKRDYKKILMSAMIMFLFAGGIMGFILSGVPFGVQSAVGGGSVKYNGFSFTQTQTGILSEINDRDFLFGYYPAEVEYIQVDNSIVDTLRSSRMTYITSDVNSTEAQAIGGFAYSLGQALESKGLYAQVAFNSSNRFNFPVVTCKDATSFVPVIFVQVVNSSSIYQENNCIFINSTSAPGIERLRDRLVYGVLGVIE